MKKKLYAPLSMPPPPLPSESEYAPAARDISWVFKTHICMNIYDIYVNFKSAYDPQPVKTK